MGAAASLFYMADNPGAVNCSVLDSGFSSMTDVINSMAGTMGIPPEFVQMLFPMIEEAVE
jgi:pimeloyl-ACP methyl ester carboxylesterase